MKITGDIHYIFQILKKKKFVIFGFVTGENSKNLFFPKLERGNGNSRETHDFRVI